jgi:hypothetical protein
MITAILPSSLDFGLLWHAEQNIIESASLLEVTEDNFIVQEQQHCEIRNCSSRRYENWSPQRNLRSTEDPSRVARHRRSLPRCGVIHPEKLNRSDVEPGFRIGGLSNLILIDIRARDWHVSPFMKSSRISVPESEAN